MAPLAASTPLPPRTEFRTLIAVRNSVQAMTIRGAPLFGSKHSVSVWPTQGGRKYQYRCTCGARGWSQSSNAAAQRAGERHVAAKSR